MTVEDLRDEVSLELQSLETTVREALGLRRDVAGREATVRERTAAAAFLAQFYGGVENILKRLCRFHAVAMPTGETWHVELYQRFCAPGGPLLPILFDEKLAAAFSGYRKFRHVVHHGYSFQLDWARIGEGIDGLEQAFSGFRMQLECYLASLEHGRSGAD